ncbi:COX15/CtaA family protein [Halomonas qinghailakensis]|uniref:COX15/CtaA family protein n=2 Tax=Halomonas TaxID=2745 RepID=A0AA46TQ71_9GAMM|nr:MULTISPECIES: COX15/CtaA family protein [Halomonas]UYO74535.1 COX15/CtaA family protein [Halomonas sp. ZZQ-149]UYV20524.1 COX15/CtaA family protein [Halomonas qaidamensis]
MPHSTERRLQWLKYITLAGTALTALVILVGAWTRLVDAGLGCPDWPGCYGRLLVPDNEHAALRHPDVPLEPFKAWVEMAHRYVASFLGLIVLSVVAIGWSLRKSSGYPWKVSLALLVVILLQGAFGAFTVTLKLWPQVVTLHLLGGLSVLTLFFWVHMRIRLSLTRHLTTPSNAISSPKSYVSPTSSMNLLWVIGVSALILQLALGGWVTSNYSGIACQGFPTCNTQWWPEMDISEGFHLTQTVGPNYLHGQLHADARTAIHMMHRLGALLLGIALLVLWWRYRTTVSVGRALTLVVMAYVIQVILGVANVLLWLPLWLALLHTAGAVALTISMGWAVWCWRYQDNTD